jgi:hypothetical protein
MMTIHLALSERAAVELKNYIDGGRDRADYSHGVLDNIAAELVSQLNGGARVMPTPIEVGTFDGTAVAIAKQMAAAGAQAIHDQKAAAAA